jgi:hypothetical protein
MLSNAAWITLRILAFRAGPQDLPFSHTLTQLVVPLAMAVNFLQFRYTMSGLPALTQAVVSVLALVAYTALLLQLRDRRNRLQQTCNALLATNVVLTLLALPAFTLLEPVLPELISNPDALSEGRIPALPLWTLMLISLWSITVSGHIFRHALEIKLWVGLIAAMGGAYFVFVASRVAAMLFAP